MSRLKSAFNVSILSFAILFAGCAKAPISNNVRAVELTSDAQAVVVAMKNLDQKTCEIMYKQYAGLSEYMENAGENVDNTNKLFKLVDGFQEDYGYVKKQNKDFTAATKTFLTNRSYKTPKKIVDAVSDETKEVARETVVKDMRILAAAAKAALESKNAK